MVARTLSLSRTGLGPHAVAAVTLTRAGHDVRLVKGAEGYGPNHGGTVLPGALRWLWSQS